MGTRTIRQGNDHILREKCPEIKEITPEILRLIDDMVETMHSADGIGLAAPQIGIPKRLVVIDIQEGDIMVLVNPRVVEQSGEDLAIEGCLSFPGLYGEVPRASRVKVEAMNKDGEIVVVDADGLLARALQHEIDHLNGVLFVDRVTRFVRPEEEGQG